MFAKLPIVRSLGARCLFLGSAAVTTAILLWTNRLHPTGSAGGLTPIFFRLFTIEDYGGANCMLLILLVAALTPIRYSSWAVLNWIGRHPGAVALAGLVILCCGSWTVYMNSRLCMDEYSPFFQSQIFAAGHLSGQFPAALLNWLVPTGFQDFFLNVSHSSGRVSSAYWPSFALLLTPFTWAGIPWACNPLISAFTLLAVHRVTLRIFNNVESAGLALLLTAASPVFFADGISYYSMSAHMLANTLFVLLLIEPTPRRALAAGLVGSGALALHNPVPHMLFAAPWIIWILRRPGSLPLAGWLFAGYLPLCLLLGFGWFFYSSHLTHEGIILAAGTSASGDSLIRMGSAFDLPSSTITLARLIGLAKVWVWAVPGLLLLAIFGGWKYRHNTPCRLLAISAILTLVLYVFIPVDQGHGWGYRYFHSAWLALPILAAAAIVPRSSTRQTRGIDTNARISAIFEDSGTRAFIVACALVTVIVGTGFRAVQIRSFVAHHESQQPSYSGTERRVVIIDPRFSYYGADLVQNDPWLRGSVIRMITHGSAADAQMMRENFPEMHPVHIDKFGSVWSAVASAARTQ
jgi:hypothetical protein